MEVLLKQGYLDKKVDKNLDLKAEINKLRKEKNAVILAHYYQEKEIQEISDFLGDSLALAQQAAKTKADIILFAGVHFMAETAKILNPDKKVILPDLNAGCSLADSCPPSSFRAFKEKHPDHIVITYINCSAEIKALSDLTCTSSNAVKIINSVPKGQPIIFAPDKNLGQYLINETGRDMLLWDGSCMVHEAFSLDKLMNLVKKHPDAELIAHPESEQQILKFANYIGSTAGLLKYVNSSTNNKFIVGTEAGILHQMEKEVPAKTLLPLPSQEDNTCACSECFYMKMNTLEKLYLCLKYELPEIVVPENIAKEAIKPIKRMLELS